MPHDDPTPPASAPATPPGAGGPAAAPGPPASVAARLLPGLPPLAWLAEVGPGGVSLLHGADVETFPDGCFEGCWAGDFDARGFDEAPHVFGSGLKVRGGRALFVTPSHTLDALYALRRDGGRAVAVSNSLAFLVRFAGLELPFDLGIGARLTSVKRGLGAYERAIFEGPGWTLHRFVHENFEVRAQAAGGDGVPRPAPKPPEPAFADYAGYEALLEGVLAAVARNGAAPGRRVRYPLTTTCSSGYDSTACAALAAPLGCRRALTLGTARNGLSDSGREVAAALGLELVELERPSRARGTGLEEAEFFATGMGGEDYVFLGFGPRCARHVLLTGFHGDVVWDRLGGPADDLRRKDVSGSTMTELRLRHGFVQVPVPFIGATRHGALLAISGGEEMRPYRVAEFYDRPVPRRIAEERGVPRGAFGTVKKAASVVFDWGGLFWSPHTLRDLRAFEARLLARQGVPRAEYRRRCAWQSAALLGAQAVAWSGKKVGLPKLGRPILGPIVRRYRYTHPRYDSMAFLWAVERVGTRYAAADAWCAAPERRGTDAARGAARAGAA